MASGTVGTGGCYAIGIEVVAGREPGCCVDKGLGEVSGKERYSEFLRVISLL